MNVYLEKIASLTKAAWDSDFEAGSHYGICSNRSIGTPSVHDMLWKATKDPHVRVEVEGDDGSACFTDDPEGFKKVMDEIRVKIGPRKSPEELSSTRTMDWHRDHSWSMSMDTSGDKVKSYLGKEDKYGGHIDSPHRAVLHHLDKYL